MNYLTGWDWAIIVFYFAIIAGISVWAVKKKHKKSAEDYFLAGRHLGWFIIGASIFASNIGSEHLVGLAGSGATDGVALAHYELHAWCLLVLGWVMVPFYMRSKVFTMPEFLEKRFTPKARTVLSIISLIAYILTKIAVGIYAGGIVFRALLPEIHFMGMDTFWIGSILLIVLTGIYTIVGGLRAVVYTETLQTFVKIIGAVMVTYFGLKALGGTNDMRVLQKGAGEGDHNAALAIEIFCRSIAKTIGSYAAVLGGLDLLIFSGGIGEHSATVRANVCERLQFLGVTLDAERNSASSSVISTDGSRVSVRVMSTEEEKQIARYCRALL